MLRVKNTVLIMLSTNLGKENHYSKMFERAKGEYEPLFLKKVVDLMCEDCKKQKKDPSACNHNDHRNPKWLSGSSKKRAKFFMTSQAMYAREVLGVTTSDENSLFEQWLPALVDKPRYPIKMEISNVFYSYIGWLIFTFVALIILFVFCFITLFVFFALPYYPFFAFCLFVFFLPYLFFPLTLVK